MDYCYTKTIEKTCRLEYLDDDDLQDEIRDNEITQEMSDSLDTTVGVKAEKYLTEDAKI